MGFLSDIVDGITGKGAADASKDAAKLQYQASQDALEFQREALAQQTELNQPYVDLGVDNLQNLMGRINQPGANRTLRDDPYGYNYLANNPLFQAAIDNSARQLKGTAAARGKYNSGGLVDALFQNYLATGDQYYGNYLARQDSLQNSAVNRALLPVQLGQSAAVGQAANLGNFAANAGNLTTQGANSLAAGQVGQANAYSQGASNLAGIGGWLWDNRAGIGKVLGGLF